MAYKHETLVAPTSIRLLKVLPKTADDAQLQIELWEEAHTVPYRCLSYTWGDQSVTQNIRVNGSTMRVGSNLYDFLNIASQRLPGDSLWVDAICINQDDDAEKSAQVQRMGTIYEEATEVLVWLGICNEVVPLFAWACKPRTRPYSRPYLCLWKYPQLKGPLLELSRNPYWYRAWVTQELALARSLRILCGSLELPWDVFSGKIIRLCDVPSIAYRLSFGMFILDISSTLIFYQVWAIVNLTHKQSFGDVLQRRGSALQCSDPRDRLYNLLSLTYDGDDFEVDYSETALHLFLRTAAHFQIWAQPSLTLSVLKALQLSCDDFMDLGSISANTPSPSVPLQYLRFNYGLTHALGSRPKPFKVSPCSHGAQPSRGDKTRSIRRSSSDFLFVSAFNSFQSPALWVLVRQSEPSAENQVSVCVRLSAGAENFKRAQCDHFFELWCSQENGSEGRVTEWTHVKDLVSRIEDAAESEVPSIEFVLKLPHDHVHEYVKILGEGGLDKPKAHHSSIIQACVSALTVVRV